MATFAEVQSKELDILSDVYTIFDINRRKVTQKYHPWAGTSYSLGEFIIELVDYEYVKIEIGKKWFHIHKKYSDEREIELYSKFESLIFALDCDFMEHNYKSKLENLSKTEIEVKSILEKYEKGEEGSPEVSE